MENSRGSPKGVKLRITRCCRPENIKKQLSVILHLNFFGYTLLQYCLKKLAYKEYVLDLKWKVKDFKLTLFFKL